MGQDQVSGGENVLFWLVAPIAWISKQELELYCLKEWWLIVSKQQLSME